MNRRGFLELTTLGAAAFFTGSRVRTPQTRHLVRHLILVVNGGARKKDYYEDATLSPNIRRLAEAGFVFEEDHCDRISSHDAAFEEMVSGLEGIYSLVQSVRHVPAVLQRDMPRMIVCRDMTHDIGHESFSEYRRVVRATDSAVGALSDWIKADPYFSQNTAIIIRPDFGRDDEVNAQGELHHSEGFYYTHRVASIFWGPDFRKGVDSKTVVNRRDLAPLIATLLKA
jgi:hypothetical protein